MCCPDCRIVYFVPKELLDSASKHAGSYSCPNGHSRRFVQSDKDREIKRLTDALSSTERERDDAVRRANCYTDDHHRALRQLACARGQITRLRKRLGLDGAKEAE